MALFWRIWLALSVVNLAVLSLFAFLAILQFDNISSTLVGERLHVLAERTAAPFSSAARIGVPLSTVRNAKALLERARQSDDDIIAIHVFDATGRIVHSTAETPSALIPADAIAARDAASGERWRQWSDDGFYGGIEISDATGVTAGGILVVYPADSNATQIRAMVAELGLAVIVVLLVSAALSAVLLRIGLVRQIAMFEVIDTEISDFERDAWRSAAGAAPKADARPGVLHALLETAEQRYRRSGRAITAQGQPPMPKDPP